MAEPGAASAAEGAAFPPLIKLLATVMTLAVFVAGARAVDQSVLRDAAPIAKLLISSGLLTLLLFNYWVFKSRTRVDARQIEQTWIWTKRVRWADVRQAKLIYVPWLSGLVAPRLVVRSGGGLVTLFHAADPQVLAVFSRYLLAPQLRER